MFSFLKNEVYKYFSKYTVVGFSNLLLTMTIYYVMTKILSIHYLIALYWMWIFGLFFSYTINFIWTFQPEQKLNYRVRLLKYFLVYLTSFLINYFLLKLIKTDFIDDPFLSQLTVVPLIVVINYTGIRLWALKPSTNEYK